MHSELQKSLGTAYTKFETEKSTTLHAESVLKQAKKMLKNWQQRSKSSKNIFKKTPA